MTKTLSRAIALAAVFAVTGIALSACGPAYPDYQTRSAYPSYQQAPTYRPYQQPYYQQPYQTYQQPYQPYYQPYQPYQPYRGY